MKLVGAVYVLLLLPACSFNSYEVLEKKLKEVFTERTGILRQLSKTSKELDSIKGNLQSLKNDDAVPKKDVQRILELSHKQEEMKSLQTALQKQLDEAAERAEKQQATIKFLKMEMEKKTKIIKDLQQENKSLKNKLLSGNKLCDIHAEESKKIQAQLKELRYGKKDLIFKDIPKVPRITTSKLPVNVEVMRRDPTGVKDCQMVKVGAECFQNQTEKTSVEKTKTGHNQLQPRSSESSGHGSARTPADSGKTESGPENTHLDKHN
uniref:Leucine zipper protein 2 n=1 Tax=Astyanax mexicanus TaxID=7994 RepID=A0A3B1JD20_ASTMX